MNRNAGLISGIAGTLLVLIGLLGVLGYILDSHLLKSFITGLKPEVAFSSACALILLGLDMLVKRRNKALSRIILAAVLLIALYNMGRYFVEAQFYILMPLIERYPHIPMSFLTSVQLFAVAVGLMLYSRYPGRWWAINGLAVVGLWLLATVVFALVGYGVRLPALFSYVQSLPAILGFAIIALVLVQEAVIPPGILSPLVSHLRRVRTLSAMTVLVATLILVAGIVVIYIFQEVISQGSATLETDALFVAFELSTVSLAMLMLLLSMRVLYYYESSLRSGEALNRLTEELEDRVSARTSELEKLSRQKSQVLSMVSHDLKTPLAAMNRFTEILARDDTNLTQSQKDLVGYIAEGATQMRAMVTDVLDRARIEAGKVTIRPERFEVLPLVSRLFSAIEPLAVERGIELVSEVPFGLQATADPNLLRQILLNLLSNAVKYNKRNGKVWLRAYEDAEQGQVVITVQDTGIGIPADQIPKLFAEFYRIGAGMNIVEGTGLGLASTRKLVELHGGTVSVSSVEGEGSIFKVMLPQTPPQAGPRAEDDQLASETGAS